jgi:hypothetical protein
MYLVINKCATAVKVSNFYGHNTTDTIRSLNFITWKLYCTYQYNYWGCMLSLSHTTQVRLWGEWPIGKIRKEAVRAQSKCIIEYSSMKAFMVSFYAPEGITHLLLTLHLFMIFGLLNNSLPCFSIHNHLTPILNLHFSQILSDMILPS